ncbi:hypothetical protein FKM82_005856 [Ascaphus truei]
MLHMYVEHYILIIQITFGLTLVNYISFVAKKKCTLKFKKHFGNGIGSVEQLSVPAYHTISMLILNSAIFTSETKKKKVFF